MIGLTCSVFFHRSQSSLAITYMIVLVLALILFVCALSVSSAVFLILDLGNPFDGIIRISDEPLRVALEQLGR